MIFGITVRVCSWTLPQTSSIAPSSFCAARQKLEETVFKYANQKILTAYAARCLPLPVARPSALCRRWLQDQSAPGAARVRLLHSCQERPLSARLTQLSLPAQISAALRFRPCLSRQRTAQRHSAIWRFSKTMMSSFTTEDTSPFCCSIGTARPASMPSSASRKTAAARLKHSSQAPNPIPRSFCGLPRRLKPRSDPSIPIWMSSR